jgi:hypothetical protein
MGRKCPFMERFWHLVCANFTSFKLAPFILVRTFVHFFELIVCLFINKNLQGFWIYMISSKTATYYYLSMKQGSLFV